MGICEVSQEIVHVLDRRLQTSRSNPQGTDVGSLQSNRRVELRLIGGSHYPEWSLLLAPTVGQNNRIEHLASMQRPIRRSAVSLSSKLGSRR